MQPQDLKIVIIGGGVGGLGTAIALRRKGFRNVSVYERDLGLFSNPQFVSSALQMPLQEDKDTLLLSWLLLEDLDSSEQLILKKRWIPSLSQQMDLDCLMAFQVFVEKFEVLFHSMYNRKTNPGVHARACRTQWTSR
jgi:glycine/D-amino acid oxidase-like deaminating enzyme